MKSFSCFLKFPKCCHKPAEATSPVAAHLTCAAVAVIKLPGPIRLTRNAGGQQNDTVSPNAAVAIAKANDLLPAQLDLVLPIVDQNKVIAGAVHFGETQNHGPQSIVPGANFKTIAS